MVEHRQHGSSGNGDGRPQSDGPTTTEHADEALRQEARRIREDTERRAAHAKEEMRELAEEQKTAAVVRLARIARALRAAGDRLHDEHELRLATFSLHAAERLERASHDLERRDPGQLVRDTEDLARRYPDVFLGGVALTGILIGRFLRSSARSTVETEDRS